MTSNPKLLSGLRKLRIESMLCVDTVIYIFSRISIFASTIKSYDISTGE